MQFDENIQKISEVSKHEIKEIFSDVIRSSEFYEQIEFDDFVKFVEKNDNVKSDLLFINFDLFLLLTFISFILSHIENY